MSDTAQYIMDRVSNTLVPVISEQQFEANVDYIITDYMERLSTRLNILEAELKYAWRALDLLSQEYIKMWERLEKLENLLYEQQNVIAQLLDFYTSESPNENYELSENNACLDSKLGQLEVIREILGNGTVEDGLEEGVDVTIVPDHRVATTALMQELDLDLRRNEMQAPDEAFYKSLNQAYRDDLIGCDTSRPPSQLGLIWEEVEDIDDGHMQHDFKIDSAIRIMDDQDVFSALDYKDYRGNSPCINEQDLAQLNRISTIDQIAIKKLDELDRLSNKIQQDSINIKNLQSKLYVDDKSEIGENSINGHAPKSYGSSEMWNFSSQPSGTKKSNSRLSLSESVIGTDNEVAETLARDVRSASPRRKTLDISVCGAPYTTITGRLAYSTAVQNAEAAAAVASKNPFYTSDIELNPLVPVSYETVSSMSPILFTAKAEKPGSPTMSVCSVRTRQDGYIGSPSKGAIVENVPSDTSTPPPPAPWDVGETFMVSQNELSSCEGTIDTSRLTPLTSQSPKSPKASPKRNQSNIVNAKSDSGLSSMSGWSSLEKSPCSPKSGANYKVQALNYYTDYSGSKHAFNMAATSFNTEYNTKNTKGYTETNVDSYPENPRCSSNTTNTILPGGHHMSAFTTVKSPCTLESSGNFVPAPAPASDINVTSRLKKAHSSDLSPCEEYDTKTEHSAAGSKQSSFSSACADNTSEYMNHNLNYPDLIEPYEHNELNSLFKKSISQSETTNYSPSPHMKYKKKHLTRTYSTEGRSADCSTSNDYSANFQRTMFPTGNITDTLCYYPTSTRYDTTSAHPTNSDYRDPSAWLNSAEGPIPFDSTSTSSSLRSAETIESEFSSTSYADRQMLIQKHNEQRMYQQIVSSGQEHAKSNNQRQEIPYLELDLKNKNVPEYVVQQHTTQPYDSANVVLTNSGYITITTDGATKEKKFSKKLKRVNTIISAVSSVGHWLPDLHLKKRNRSYSLPSSDRKEIQTKSVSKGSTGSQSKKKKKSVIMSTVSGIIQKAKRHNNNYQSHSLSDPEQSETEWGPGRTSSVISEDDRSEDSCSLASEYQSDRDILQKMYAVKSKQLQNLRAHEEDQENLTPEEHEELAKQDENNADQTSLENIFDQLTENEESSKSTDNSLNLFATIGDAKRIPLLSDKSDDSTTSENKAFPQVALGGASMEFAVSRALGKYRQRQSSTVLDEQAASDEPDKTNSLGDEQTTNYEMEEKAVESQVTQMDNTSTDVKHSLMTSESIASENSPSALSLRGNINRMFPRHQQSLEIPGYREDDDVRSTHSWRSGSRVSSRRQSTEDSIDSEDEWYCYELRKLEEMEKQSQIEAEVGETLKSVPEVEDNYEPDPNVKEKMCFVLRELRMKAKVTEGVLDEKDNNLQTISSAGRRQSRDSYSFHSASSFEFEDEGQEKDNEYDLPKPSMDDERSSGDTSGPDSPHSFNECEETQDSLFSFARCSLKYTSKEGLPPNELELEKVEPQAASTTTPALPEIKIDNSCSKEEDAQEASQDPSSLSSKWKLLKALKERKAEEKICQGKAPETPGEKEKVSMLNMMQKFYEVHVKT